MTAQVELGTCTERMMLNLLYRRYSRRVGGNGPRYICAEHVRSKAGASLDQIMLPYLHVEGEKTLYQVYREREQRAIEGGQP